MTDHQPISLGELIDLLAVCPRDDSVSFDFCGAVPGSVDSYRGYYDHLAMSWSNRGERPTVAKLLDDLRDADGHVFTGYKGGDFRMHRDTPVWVSNYGESDSTAIIGIRDLGYSVVIDTGYCKDWSGGMERARRVLFEGLGFGNAHLPRGASTDGKP